MAAVEHSAMAPGDPQHGSSQSIEKAGDCLESCPKCGCRDLFVRKNFPQKLGLLIVLGAAIAFLVLAANPGTFYIGVYVLCTAILLDALLYFFVGRITVCYQCRAEFHDHSINPEHSGFELAIAEKYRQPR
jgi:hypothetical protein